MFEGSQQAAAAAAAYVRVSTAEQAREGVSLEAQEERIEAYCKMMGLQVARMAREEGVSASRPLARRPAGAELLRLVEEGKVQHVVTLKLDRLFRDTIDALTLTRAWDQAGVSLHLIDMGGSTINTSSPMGRMVLTIMAGLAELERNQIRERTCTALRYLKAQGRKLGTPPLGKQVVGGRLVQDDQQVTTLEMMAELRAQGMTLQQVCDALTAAGRPAKQGQLWSNWIRETGRQPWHCGWT